MAIFVIISNSGLNHAALSQAGKISSSEFYPVVNDTCSSYESKKEKKPFKFTWYLLGNFSNYTLKIW